MAKVDYVDCPKCGHPVAEAKCGFCEVRSVPPYEPYELPTVNATSPEITSNPAPSGSFINPTTT